MRSFTQTLINLINHPSATGKPFVQAAAYFARQNTLAADALAQQINIALAEIGPIDPVWSDDDGLFTFEHPAYPMCLAADADKQTTIDDYLRALAYFVADRMANTLAPDVDRITSGRGGARPNSGRPKKAPTQVVRVSAPLASWLKNSENQRKAEALMTNADKVKQPATKKTRAPKAAG